MSERGMPERDDPGDEDLSPIDALFEECLDRWAAGDPPAREELERRAGPDAAELLARLAPMHDLEELSDLLQDEPAPELERLGRYTILQLLGQGGLGRVYLALDTELEREVALKVLDAPALGSRPVRELALAEARSLARVEHESVVRVIAVGEPEDVPHVVMEYVRGPSLLDVIDALRLADSREDGAGPAARAAREHERLAARCRLVARLARALAACHAKRVIHRDVKPANVLLDLEHVPKLIDFGLALRGGGDAETRRDQERYATLPYFAPELAARGNREADAASDQYALGLVFYELLTLQHPLVRADRDETWRAVAHPDIRSPRELRRDIPADVERICMHALERDPKARYPSLDAMADDLEAFLGHRAISLEEPGLARLAWLRVRRNPLHVALAAALALVLALIAGHLTLEWHARRGTLARLDASLERALASGRPELDLAACFSDVLGAREAAERYDRAGLAALVFAPVAPRVEERRSRADRRLHELLEADYEAAGNPHHSPRENAERFRDLDARWRAAAGFELTSSSARACGCDHHLLGTAALRPGEELLRFAANVHPAFPELQTWDADQRFEEGMYRWRGHHEAGPWEIDLQGFPHTPRLHLEPRPLPEELAASLVLHGGGDVEHPFGGGARTYTVQRLRIASRPVTWGEVQSVLPAAEAKAYVGTWATTARIERENLTPDTPAVLPWYLAHRCATALGARVPTPAELWSALRTGAIEPPPGFEFEWTSAYIGREPATRFRLVHQPEPGTSPRTSEHREIGWPAAATCFRVVVPAE